MNGIFQMPHNWGQFVRPQWTNGGGPHAAAAPNGNGGTPSATLNYHGQHMPGYHRYVIHLKPKLSTMLLVLMQLTALGQQSPPCAADSPAPNDERAAVAAQDQREQPLQDGDQPRIILVVLHLLGQQQRIQ